MACPKIFGIVRIDPIGWKPEVVVIFLFFMLERRKQGDLVAFRSVINVFHILNFFATLSTLCLISMAIGSGALPAEATFVQLVEFSVSYFSHTDGRIIDGSLSAVVFRSVDSPLIVAYIGPFRY